MKILTLLLAMAAAFTAATAEVKIYAAPAACGRGDGSSPENAARIWDKPLWKNLQTQLQKTPVTLELAAGEYVTTWPEQADSRLYLQNIGHPENRLTIRGAANNGTRFMRNPNDSRDTTPSSRNLQTLIMFRRNCQNILIEQLYFTGSGLCGYGMHVQESRNITIRNCRWQDLRGAYYGASGASRSHNITWENCIFENVGYDAHAHMLYNLNKSSNLTVRNCRMVDCYGDYIRFRNQVQDVTVENCEFIDNGLYASSPILSFPLFIDFDVPQHHEYFSTGLTVRNNKITFKKSAPRNWMMAFHISGYNPPGRQYLVSRQDAAAMAGMSREKLRQTLDERFGLETDKIIFSGNQVTGCEDLVVYECWPKYGSEKKFPVEEYHNNFSITRAFID